MADFYRITCTLGWRLYVERFRSVDVSRVFVEKVLGKDKPKWMSKSKIVAKGGNALVIECNELEEIMESIGKAILPDDILAKIQKFLYGQWDGATVDDATPPKSEATTTPRKAPTMRDASADGDVTLGDICRRHRWDERRARRMLRTSGAKREGRWRWTNDEAKAVEAQLRDLFEK